MNKIFILIFITICWSNIWAQSTYLKVNLKNGTTASFPIQDIQKITFSGMTGTGSDNTKKLNTIVKTFMLFQNYPNPFNPSTNIEYELPKPGRVEINIFNVNGQLVRSYINEFQDAGIYKTIWDGKNRYGRLVSSGLYIYEVKFKNSNIYKKMMFVR